MHRHFVKKNSDLAHDYKYLLYKHMFNYKFNIFFGYPKTDRCDTCEKRLAYLETAKENNDGADEKN